MEADGDSDDAPVDGGPDMDLRDRAGAGRDEAEISRGLAASDREVDALERERAADARDRAADRRDDAAESRYRDRRASSSSDADAEREASRSDRCYSASDRAASKIDRSMAAIDRRLATGDREEDALDELTRALRRGPGIVELKREVVRAQRTGERFVMAFVDVVGLKEVNDSRGHGAGDSLLQAVVRSMRSRLRQYDLIVRYGGDEFVCALSGLSVVEARQRFDLIDRDLGGGPGRPAITAGLTELIPTDSLPDLIGRADADLLEQRRRLPNVGRT